MSPVEINILLHYYALTSDYSDDHEMHPAHIEAMARFQTLELIEERLDNAAGSRQYDITDRGMVYIKALKEVSLPVKKWVPS